MINPKNSIFNKMATILDWKLKWKFNLMGYRKYIFTPIYI